MKLTIEIDGLCFYVTTFDLGCIAKVSTIRMAKEIAALLFRSIAYTECQVHIWVHAPGGKPVCIEFVSDDERGSGEWVTVSTVNADAFEYISG